MHVHTDVHTCAHWDPTHPCGCAHFCMHAYPRSHICVHMHTTRVCTCPNEHVFIYAHMHAHAHTALRCRHMQAPAHMHTYTFLQTCTHALTHAHRRSGIQRGPQSPLRQREASDNWPFCCWSQQEPRGERGGRPRGWPPDPSPARAEAQGHGGQLEFCAAALPGEQPPRTYCKYYQNALNKLPLRVLLFRFTQFVNNKIKSHFNGKERVI